MKPTPEEFGIKTAVLTVEGTMHEIGVRRTTLYRLIKEGKLHSVRCGRRRLFLAVDIVAYLSKLREE